MNKKRHRTQMPDWLAAQLREHHPAEYQYKQEAPSSDDIEEGDVLVVTSTGTQSAEDTMVAVWDVYEEYQCFSGMLVTNETDLATGRDRILKTEETGLPYPIVVVTGTLGLFWYKQIQRRVGSLTNEALDGILSALIDDQEDGFYENRRGLPLLREGQDGRWSDIMSNYKRIQILSDDCQKTLYEQEIRVPFFIH